MKLRVVPHLLMMLKSIDGETSAPLSHRSFGMAHGGA
jgi:hypothetical protein